MKLTGEQASVIFDLIKDELDSDNNKAIRDAKTYNRKLQADALAKFKLTPEYTAVMMLAKSFSTASYYKDCAKNVNLQGMADLMFNVRKNSKPEYFRSWQEQKVIQLLSIDCKNLNELFEALVNHYRLKKKPTIEKYKHIMLK